LPDHVFEHLLTMARLHADNCYDRLTRDVETITGRPATSVRAFVANHPEVFGLARNEGIPRIQSELADAIPSRSQGADAGEDPPGGLQGVPPPGVSRGGG